MRYVNSTRIMWLKHTMRMEQNRIPGKVWYRDQEVGDQEEGQERYGSRIKDSEEHLTNIRIRKWRRLRNES